MNDPPASPKMADALKFGMLGASRIGPAALILPAKSHKEVVVTAVACRDKTKGSKYAKTHSISKVYSGSDCYQRPFNVAFPCQLYPALTIVRSYSSQN